MPFEIKLHPESRIIEVVYPERPTLDDVSDYLTRMKDTIDQQKGPWFCLVDQTKTGILPPELLEQVSVANSYAVVHGMQRSARLVGTVASANQANAIAKSSGPIKVVVRSFTSREEALAWLKAPAVDARAG